MTNGLRLILKTMSSRKQWFLDRVSKTVYSANVCQCSLCLESEKRGNLIDSEARALRAFLSEFKPPQFFDTYEELLKSKEKFNNQ